jgi:hypothetical protein
VDQTKLLNRLRTWGATIGPYVPLEVTMPGGSLMALLLYLHRRKQSALARANT